MQCCRCKKELPDDSFYVNHKTGGRYSLCKECNRKDRQKRHFREYVYKDKASLPACKRIVREACELFEIDFDLFYSDCKKRNVALAHKYVCQKLRDNGQSLNQIGRAVCLDHSSVVNCCNVKSRVAVKKYLEKKELVPIKRINYKTGEITIEYIEKVK